MHTIACPFAAPPQMLLLFQKPQLSAPVSDKHLMKRGARKKRNKDTLTTFFVNGRVE
jgi:hypothetical protein